GADARLCRRVRWIARAPPRAENPEHRFRAPPQANLERGPILDDARDVSGDLLGRLAERLVKILDDRVVDRHDLVEPVEWNLALGPSPRHAGIDLGDHATRRQQRRSRDVDRHAEAAHASGVRWAYLDESDVEGEPAILQQAWYLRQRHRNVVDAVGEAQPQHVAPEVERTMAERAPGTSVAIEDGAVGEEVDEVDAGRGRVLG